MIKRTQTADLYRQGSPKPKEGLSLYLALSVVSCSSFLFLLSSQTYEEGTLPAGQSIYEGKKCERRKIEKIFTSLRRIAYKSGQLTRLGSQVHFDEKSLDLSSPLCHFSSYLSQTQADTSLTSHRDLSIQSLLL